MEPLFSADLTTPLLTASTEVFASGLPRDGCLDSWLHSIGPHRRRGLTVSSIKPPRAHPRCTGYPDTARPLCRCPAPAPGTPLAETCFRGVRIACLQQSPAVVRAYPERSGTDHPLILRLLAPQTCCNTRGVDYLRLYGAWRDPCFSTLWRQCMAAAGLRQRVQLALPMAALLSCALPACIATARHAPARDARARPASCAAFLAGFIASAALRLERSSAPLLLHPPMTRRVRGGQVSRIRTARAPALPFEHARPPHPCAPPPLPDSSPPATGQGEAPFECRRRR